jgi:hypothetical protein
MTSSILVNACFMVSVMDSRTRRENYIGYVRSQTTWPVVVCTRSMLGHFAPRLANVSFPENYDPTGGASTIRLPPLRQNELVLFTTFVPFQFYFASGIFFEFSGKDIL